MPLGGELRQELTQTLRLSPQLQQSLRMLAMSLPELREELYREMDRNPVIEDVEQTLEKETVSQKERETADEERAYENDYPEDDAAPDQSYSADADALERRQKFFDSQHKEETLEEHLLKQLKMSDIDKKDIPLAEMLVGDLDAKGYFAGSMADLVMVSGESEEKIRAVLKEIMSLDPPGCGATNLEECLLAQIDKLDGSPYQDEVRELLERHLLADVAAGKIAKIEAELGVSRERYADVLTALRTLEPRPGRAYSHAGERISYVHPEVHAVKGADGRWIARVDDRSLPDIRISKHYLRMLEDPKTSKETKDYIRARIAAANAFVEAIEKREETITHIAQAILDAQPGFFREGLKGLKPLTMQEIAAKVGVHHTTVSRTVNDKYMSTPRGTVELRKFFTSGFVTDSGEQVSKDAVEAHIKSILAREDKSSPLSDEGIRARLKEMGFDIARRTVAKYRIRLGVPGASERRASR